MAANLALAIILSILYVVILNLSKGIQKYGIEGLSPETLKKWKDRPELKKKFYAWTIGTIGTGVAVVFQFAAQPFSPNSSFVAAFGGVGLLSLIIFSYYVLHEPLGKPEIIGTIIVVVATIIFGVFADDTQATEVDYQALILMAVIPLSIMFIIGAISVKTGYWGHAIIWGSIAGYFSGLGIFLSQTAAISGDRDIWAMLLTIDFIIAVATGQGAFWGTQYGFKHGEATVVVTLYNTFMLAVPIIGDIFVLKQDLPPLQIAMLILIGIGVVLLTAFRKNLKPLDETKENIPSDIQEKTLP